MPAIAYKRKSYRQKWLGTICQPERSCCLSNWPKQRNRSSTCLAQYHMPQRLHLAKEPSTASPRSQICDSRACDQPSVESSLFRHACGAVPTGVSVVTRLLDNQLYGLTVNSFASVSLKPPLILVCIECRSPFLRTFTQETRFAVNVLSHAQRAVAIQFASPCADRFVQVAWTGGLHGVPLLSQVVATFECKVWRTQGAGDHSVIIGLVKNAVLYRGAPLAFCRKDYCSINSGETN